MSYIALYWSSDADYELFCVKIIGNKYKIFTCPDTLEGQLMDRLLRSRDILKP